MKDHITVVGSTAEGAAHSRGTGAARKQGVGRKQRLRVTQRPKHKPPVSLFIQPDFLTFPQSSTSF